MATQTIVECASAIADAHRTGRPIAPISVRHPDLTVDDAYQIQLTQVRGWESDGATVKGYKVGLSSAATQRQLGVSQPDFGHLTDTMFFLDAAEIAADRFIDPRVEPEIAFILGRDLRGPGVTAADAMNAIAWVTPALEIIDSRIRDWEIGIVDTVADNASSGGVVLGSRRTAAVAIDMRCIGGILSIGGVVVDTGATGAVLGSPINALVWLANVMGERGVTLRAGGVILPGSISAAHPVVPGDVATVTFDGLGSATARFGRQGLPDDQ
ncbi:2-keto-4-pentenoate hydratase [Jongsikchunia kroppenstedtii]|uniref:2-keto-4-pentenoate hydratase n=1 Tax=Jongsikchunia kroppenstedtii TaxID=1121721 RepID=UPI00037B633F|nr:2-keto-4-pentenoate hydratase [Jongsikchunia kroppenstedtii]